MLVLTKFQLHLIFLSLLVIDLYKNAFNSSSLLTLIIIKKKTKEKHILLLCNLTHILLKQHQEIQNFDFNYKEALFSIC